MQVDKSFPYDSRESFVVSMELHDHDPLLHGELKETVDFKKKKKIQDTYIVLKYNILNNFASFIMYAKFQKLLT